MSTLWRTREWTSAPTPGGSSLTAPLVGPGSPSWLPRSRSRTSTSSFSLALVGTAPLVTKPAPQYRSSQPRKQFESAIWRLRSELRSEEKGIPPRVPPEWLTPDGLRHTLSDYVDFSLQLAATKLAECAGPPSDSSPARALTLGKGLTLQEAATFLGKPHKMSERREGTFTVLTQIFNRDGDAVTADYVEGVLVRYSISSR